MRRRQTAAIVIMVGHRSTLRSCTCVLDDDIRGKVRSKPVHVDCVNRFEPLTSQKASIVQVAVSLLVVCVVVRILITCILM